MTARECPEDRIKWLTSQLVDGDASSDEIAELNRLVQSDPNGVALVVDHLLLDSLLSEELGTESLTALVDLVAGPEGAEPDTKTEVDAVTAANRAQPGRDDVRASWFGRNAGWLVAAASLVVGTRSR